MATPTTSNTFTVPADLQIIIANKTNTDIFLNLPAANTVSVFVRYIKIKGNNTNIARLTPASGTVDGQPYWQSSDNNRALQLVPHPPTNDWLIVGFYND